MRSPTFIAVAAFLAMLLAAGIGMATYDHARRDRIAEGITVGGVDVGGMQRAAAARRLREELVRPLTAPVVVRAGGRRFRLTARAARVSADVDGMVDQAVRRGRSGNVLTRTLRTLTGGEVQADVEPRVSFSRRAVGRLVARVEDRVERRPRSARVEFRAAELATVRGRHGVALDAGRLRERLEAALVRPAGDRRVVTARLRRTRPEVTVAELADRYPTVVTVDRGAFTLRLFKRLKLARSFPIAVGQAGLETPAGLYDIENKAVNPAWHVPNSDWAGELAGRVIPPGPDNPIKARWMGIYAGAGIHGTSDEASIGTNASHGCIRMRISDVIELYDRVPIGARVYIA